MNKKLLHIPLSLALFHGALEAAELSGSVSFVSDYRYNGISQTAGDAATQGSINVFFENGLYAGLWGSNVDFGAFGPDANLEVDYYLGYYGTIKEALSYDVSYAWYSYPGFNSYEGEYGEIAISGSYSGATITYKFANDYFNTGEQAHYISLDYVHQLPYDFSLTAHAGRSFGDYWGVADIDDYEDYSVGIGLSKFGLDISVSYIFNDIKSGQEVDSGIFRNDDAVVFGISKSI